MDELSPRQIAELVQAKATTALSGLCTEMEIGHWRPEFRAIVWGAVARLAIQRQIDAEAARHG